MTRTEKG